MASSPKYQFTATLYYQVYSINGKMGKGRGEAVHRRESPTGYKVYTEMSNLTNNQSNENFFFFFF